MPKFRAVANYRHSAQDRQENSIQKSLAPNGWSALNERSGHGRVPDETPIMNVSQSIFDLTAANLTAAEKLQLVEDLGDDLAATPELVPIHWQLEFSITASPQAGVVMPAREWTWQ